MSALKSERFDPNSSGVKVSPIPIINFERGYAFFWSAKAGCTSFGRAVLGDIGALERYQHVAPAHLNHNQPNYIDAIRNEINRRYGIRRANVAEVIVSNDLYCFKVVRHPFERAVSCYLMFMRAGFNGDPDRNGIRTALAQRFGLERPTQASFKNYLTWLSEIDIRNANIHIRPQRLDIERDHPEFVDDIVRLERLDTDLPCVERKLGLDLASAVQDRGIHAAVITGEPDFTVATRSFENYVDVVPPYHSFYTEEVGALVRQVYEEDFEAYGYKDGSW